MFLIMHPIIILPDRIFEIPIRFRRLDSSEPVFGHGAVHKLDRRILLDSYYLSCQNTNTGRFTRRMWRSVFREAKNMLRSS